MRTPRTFVAFKVVAPAKKELQRLQAELEKRNQRAGVKWTVAENFHVTIHFNGAWSAETTGRAQDLLQTVTEKHQSFSCWLERLDAFPNWTRPQIIIVRVVEDRGESRRLEQELLEALVKAGLPVNLKPWQPHITIGRNKRGEPLVGWREMAVKKFVWAVDSVELMKSELNSSGPMYTVLGSFPLKTMA